MAATFTVTGTSGAGLSLTAVVFTGVVSFNYDTISGILSMTDASGHISQVATSSATTFTWTKAAGNYTVTIS